MAQWLRLLLANGQYEGRQVIAKEALQQTHVPASVRGVDPKTGAAAFYGLGWNVDYREHGVEWSHAGAFSAGARTLVHLIPGEQLGIVVLSNAFPTGVPEGIAKTFFDLVFVGSPTRDWVAYANEIFEAGYKEMMKPVARLRNAAGLAGAAPADIGLSRRLSQRLCRRRQGHGIRAGRCFCMLGPAGRRFPLAHFNRDVFVYTPMAEAPKARWV